VICVPDTSVLVPALVDGGPAGDIARTELNFGDVLIAPALLDIEIAHVLRARVHRGKLAADQARAALVDVALLPIQRFEATPLLQRMWELRDNVTAYDAAYVALAELFDAAIITADRALASAAGPRCRFRVVTAGG
jgi:predicted nucleic acid-binding protein